MLIENITFLLIGFSIISAGLLAATHLNCKEYKGKPLPRLAGFALLLGLAALQYIHFIFLNGDNSYVHSKIYTILLFTVAPAFYFFSRELLKVKNSVHPIAVLHLLPLIIGFFLSRQYALPLAFFVGTGYVLWLALIVYKLRAQRNRFKMELFALAAMFVVALLVLLLGIVLPFISEVFFYTTYSILIGLTFIVALFTLLQFPDITSEVAEAVYATSTLKNIDCNALELKLRQLVEVEKLYTDETLSLSKLAEQIGVNTHQLSELINTRFKKSFSQFIREYRVNEAKQMLIAEPKASVLSIGLSTGFTSQSNFYSAFRDITGMAPGNYRKKELKGNRKKPLA